VQTEFSYNYCVNELTMFIKKIHICSFDPTLYIYIILRSNSL
jgi:hypothetical protein